MGRPSTEYPIVNGPSLKGMGVRVMVGEGVRVGVSVWVGVEDGVADGMLAVLAVDKAMDEEGFRRKSKAGVRSRKMVINTQAVRKLMIQKPMTTPRSFEEDFAAIFIPFSSGVFLKGRVLC